VLKSGSRFSKAPETFRARKAIFRSSVSKNREVYTPETSSMQNLYRGDGDGGGDRTSYGTGVVAGGSYKLGEGAGTRGGCSPLSYGKLTKIKTVDIFLNLNR